MGGVISERFVGDVGLIPARAHKQIFLTNVYSFFDTTEQHTLIYVCI